MATKTRKVASQNPYANALDQILPHKEVIRRSVVEFLRERSGRSMDQAARINGQTFDWKAFNAQFRQQYGDLPLPDLMRYAREKFGIESLSEVREARKQQKALRDRRLARLNGWTSDTANAEVDEFDDLAFDD